METTYCVEFVELLTPEARESRLRSHFIEDDLADRDVPFLLEIWTLANNTLIHRENGPAITVTNLDTGQIVLEEWRRYGERHRIDGPCRIARDGDETDSRWYHRDRLHRLDGPAVLNANATAARPLREEWHKAGRSHREDGPDLIWTDADTGVRTFEEWHREGVSHRIDGPQFVERDHATGIAVREEWYVNGKAHRLGGPPVISRDRITGKASVSEEFPGPTERGILIPIGPPTP